jgi:hypothetical protein
MDWAASSFSIYGGEAGARIGKFHCNSTDLVPLALGMARSVFIPRLARRDLESEAGIIGQQTEFHYHLIRPGPHLITVMGGTKLLEKFHFGDFEIFRGIRCKYQDCLHIGVSFDLKFRLNSN